MLPLLMGLIGLPAGLALDALIERLAVPPTRGGTGAPRTGEMLQSETGAAALTTKSSVATWRRAVVVLTTAGLFAAAGARYDDPSHLAIVGAYICVLVACAATDLLAYRVPNVITYPAMLGALAVGALTPGAEIKDVLGGGLIAGGCLLVPSIITGGAGMGMGDVKLAAFAGFALGFSGAIAMLVLMAIGGGIVAILLLLTRLRKRGEPMPYAPFISAGALATLLLKGTAFIQL
jgi:prepilin signal peptidase PulO-like enzyme (type II secretory pathway)